MQQAKRKRQRISNIGDKGSPRKSRRRSAITSKHFDASIKATTQQEIEGNLSKGSPVQQESTEEVPTVWKPRHAEKGAPRVRTPWNSCAHYESDDFAGDDGGNPVFEADNETSISRNGTLTRVKAIPSEDLDNASSATKHRRKRKAPTSPYFEITTPQLSSPPLTPTPPARTKFIPKKSKISIIEAPGVLPSLPHFRPTSENEFGLVQEKLRHEPWKMLVAVIFLNVTTAKMALPLLAELFKRWPTPEALSQGKRKDMTVLIIADFEELSAFLYPIGLYNSRARRLIDFSTMWLSQPPRHDVLTMRKGLARYPPTAISHLPGVISYIRCVLSVDGSVCIRFLEDVLRW